MGTCEIATISAYALGGLRGAKSGCIASITGNIGLGLFALGMFIGRGKSIFVGFGNNFGMVT